MQKTVVVFYTDAPYYGGAEYYVYLVAAGLPRDRFDVRVVLRPLDSLNEFRGLLRDAGLPIFEPPEPNRVHPGHWWSVYRYLRQAKADILHVSLAGPFDGRRGSIPFVGRLAGARVVTTEQLPMVRGGPLRSMMKRLSGRFIDAVITVSDANVVCLREIHGVRKTPIYRVYNAIDVDAYSPESRRGEARAALGLAEGERGIGIVGRLDPMKGHRFFLAAAEQVHGEFPETRFFVVGEGWLRASLERKVEETGLGDAVRFLGHRRDIETIVQGFDVVVVASTLEGMPFALLEALALERPVVATDVYGLGEVIRDGETGRLVPPEDSDAIARALGDLLRAPDKATALGVRGREVVAKEFRREDMVRQTAEIYESVLRGGR